MDNGVRLNCVCCSHKQAHAVYYSMRIWKSTKAGSESDRYFVDRGWMPGCNFHSCL